MIFFKVSSRIEIWVYPPYDLLKWAFHNGPSRRDLSLESFTFNGAVGYSWKRLIFSVPHSREKRKKNFNESDWAFLLPIQGNIKRKTTKVTILSREEENLPKMFLISLMLNFLTSVSIISHKSRIIKTALVQTEVWGYSENWKSKLFS